jgi:hypothetical protein
MTLHLVKLCVGATSIEDMESWIAETIAEKRARGMPAEQIHTTRQTPKRAADLLDGGSLYWVIKGVIQCRQTIADLRTAVGADGIERCSIVLEPKLILTEPYPRRPFQGWRYLTQADTPRDLIRSPGATAVPPELLRELAGLGLL